MAVIQDGKLEMFGSNMLVTELPGDFFSAG